MRLGEAHFLQAGRRAPLHLAGDARNHARAPAVAIGLLLALVQHVDAVPGRGGVVDEAFAALLAVGQEVEADILLLAQRQQGGVVLRLVQRRALETKAGAAALGGGEPGRPRQAAHAGRHQRSEFHRSSPRRRRPGRALDRRAPACQDTGFAHSRHSASSTAMMVGPRNRPSSPNDSSPPNMPSRTQRNGSLAAPPMRMGRRK